MRGYINWTTSRAPSLSPELRGCLRRNWPDHLSRGIRRCLGTNGRTMSDHLRPGHLGTQSCEDVSRETDRATSGQGISEPRVARISQAKLTGQPRARHFGTQSCEDVSSETGWTISHASYRSLELRGCRRRNLPDHLSRGLSEPTIAGGRVRRRARARRRGNSRRHCHRHHRRPFPLPFPPVPPALPRPPPLSSSVRAEPARGPAEPTARNKREGRRENTKNKKQKRTTGEIAMAIASTERLWCGGR